MLGCLSCAGGGVGGGRTQPTLEGPGWCQARIKCPTPTLGMQVGKDVSFDKETGLWTVKSTGVRSVSGTGRECIWRQQWRCGTTAPVAGGGAAAWQSWCATAGTAHNVPGGVGAIISPPCRLPPPGPGSLHRYGCCRMPQQLAHSGPEQPPCASQAAP